MAESIRRGFHKQNFFASLNLHCFSIFPVGRKNKKFEIRTILFDDYTFKKRTILAAKIGTTCLKYTANSSGLSAAPNLGNTSPAT